MSSPETTQIPLFNVADVKSYITNWPSNASNALKGTFASLGIRDYIRLVWIIGGYIFLRPHIEKIFKMLFEKGQKKNEEGEEEDENVHAKMSANDLRGVSSGVDYPGHEDDEEEEDENVKSPVPQWGRAARLRQKKAIQLIEEEFARKQAEDDDKDIEDLLED
ncbi:hypothetical protein AAP_03283 [Ascosphaera apis ARSEF 7405]|uniref:Protein trafficking Pga2 n=1 Tax=Ascosphaera apis ARSEF 7405 TaxID=392613 RepID=A0A167YNX5_9EURO|nr:hypothetical protein AAP_03283 [Ascosphaera apis ARSEF 7405]